MKRVDPAIIEFANDAFYLAFNSGDVARMEALWAHEYATVCIHPGWPPLCDRDDIMESWESILSSQVDAPRVICHEPRQFQFEGIYSVVCFEQLPNGWLVATNNFVLEQGEVRIVHHQASACMEPPDITPTTQIVQ